MKIIRRGIYVHIRPYTEIEFLCHDCGCTFKDVLKNTDYRFVSEWKTDTEQMDGICRYYKSRKIECKNIYPECGAIVESICEVKQNANGEYELI